MAKIKGGYVNISDGNPYKIYELLTGFNSESLFDKYTFYDLRKYIFNNYLAGLDFKGHAYSLLNTH